jgi:DNA-binding protein Fis
MQFARRLQTIRDAIQQNNINYKWRIITLVREPIGRNLSAYFQNLEIFFANDYDKKRNTLNQPILEEVMETYINKFDHDKPMRWFDEEIKGILGIDVFAEPFSVDEGYKIYSNENYDLLLIRMESLDASVKKAIHEYLDLDDFELIKTNIGSDKGYSVLYSQVKENIRLPSEYLDRLLSSKYMLKFL